MKYIRDNSEFFSRIPKSAVDVIDVCTNIKNIRERLEYAVNPESGEEEANMCRALYEIERNAERRGKKQGIEQGNQRANKLIRLLLTEGRTEDLLRSATDALFQQLFQEYHI